MLQATFPYHQNPPAGFDQLGLLTSVSFNVSDELPSPEILAGGRRGSIEAAFVPVPEAAMDEDNQAMLRKNEIRLTGQVLPVKPEAKTTGMKIAPYSHFRICVLTTDAAHAV
ncbi:hypothetical protein GCM10017767_06500 [Halomonas urumqiensis]|nr:hypothetical protein GCM10017767_06500 [Halomonas urumqiensis]